MVDRCSIDAGLLPDFESEFDASRLMPGNLAGALTKRARQA
jgi:hypothetical protein